MTKILEEAGAYVDKFSLNYGMKWRNPVDEVLFYRRDDATEGVYKRKEHMSHLAPNKFQEFYVRLYLRSRDQLAHDAARRVFKRWCAQKFQNGETESVSSMIAPSPGRVMSKSKAVSSMAKRNGSKTVGLGERKRKRARAGQTGCETEARVIPSKVLPPQSADMGRGLQLP